ncbi:MAG: ABC transporter permease [Reichenbachiella sp.]
MFKNYLRVTFRNLTKNKSYVIINTFGLGIAIACCITSYLLVGFNVEFDDFHKDKKVENIFRVHTHVLLNGSDKRIAVSTPSPVGPMVAQDIAGIKSYLRYGGSMSGGASVSYVDEQTGVNNTFGENINYADSNFFEMFDFPLVTGSPEAFKDLQSIYINQDIALKYFGDEDPIGKILTLGFARGVEKKAVIGGVFDKISVNSSIVPSMLVRFEHFVELREMDMAAWGDWNVPATFVELEDPSQAENIASQFDKYFELRNESFKEQEIQQVTLEPFKSSIDSSNLVWTYLNTPIQIEPLILFIVLALMILLIACFNLTNTSIAMIGSRLKEIGVRKSMGANKTQIITQFLFETVIVTLLSLVVGYIVSTILVPEFSAMWDLPYGISDLSSVNLIMTLLFIVVMTSLLAGVYPALFSSRLNTISLLKGTVKIKGTGMLTRALVATQFAISVIVLIGGVVFIQNSAFQEAIDFGYDKKSLMVIDIQNESEYTTLTAKAQSNPDILEIGSTEHHLGMSTYNNPVTFESQDYDVSHLEFGKNYFETMNFEFIHGRPLDYDKSNDFNDGVVVSRQLLKTLNIQGDPIGQTLTIRENRKRIVGVIEDFVDNVYRSKDPQPFLFYPTVGPRWKSIIVRADEKNIEEVDQYLEQIWKETYPTKPYSSRFQEDIVLADTKQTNGNLKNIFLFLTILGGLLSVSGIYSLASLNIAKRKKEIGIRKALGASMRNILVMMNREFMIVLVVSGIMGGVGGYYGTNWILDLIYAFHVSVQMLPIILSAMVIIIIGITTTSFTIYRGALSNPTDTLRNE